MIGDLSNKIKAAQKNERLFMSFSTGADSIAMFLRLLESDQWDMAGGVYYYMYYIPGISWIDEYIDYFQLKFGVKIVQVPSPILLNDLCAYNFQPPGRVMGIKSLEGTDKSIVYIKRDTIEDTIKVYFDIDSCYCAVGVKSGDSAMRRLAMRKTQGVRHDVKKWYPIWDYENRDVVNIIKRHGCKVPYDYELFGITFENIDYRFGKVMRDRCPKNWDLVKEWLPFADMGIDRVEKYHPEWKPKKGWKIGKFEGLVLEPKGEL